MNDRKGRLIKSTSYLQETISIEKYPWLHFSDDGICLTDNVQKNIILSKYHEHEELDKKVKTPESFFQSFAGKKRVLQPEDFSDDYINHQKRLQATREKVQLDEEEILNRQLALMHEQGLAGEFLKTHQQKAEQQAPAASTGEPVQAIVYENNVLQEDHDPVKQAVSEDEVIEEKEDVKETEKPQEQDGSKEIKEAEKAEEEHTKKIWTEAFESGFQEGQHRGELAAKAKTEEYFASLSATLTEMNTLRTEIFEMGQDVFLKIVHACSEQLLRKQLEYDDESLKNLFHNIVKGSLNKQSLRAEMNPEDIKRLENFVKNTGAEWGQDVQFVENPDLKPGDFKVHLDSEVMVAELNKLVERCIGELSVDIFKLKKVV